MIEYLEIINKIKNVKEDCIDEFNKYVSIPLELSNLESKVKTEEDSIVIEKNGFCYTLDLEARGAFSEILFILKKLDRDLYNKIDYKYIDFFERFKDTNFPIEFENLDNYNLKKLSLDILTIFNLKFWCETAEDKKSFLDNLKNEIKIKKDVIDTKIEKNEINQLDNTTKIIAQNWWTKIVNKIRSILKK